MPQKKEKKEKEREREREARKPGLGSSPQSISVTPTDSVKRALGATIRGALALQKCRRKEGRRKVKRLLSPTGSV